MTSRSLRAALVLAAFLALGCGDTSPTEVTRGAASQSLISRLSEITLLACTITDADSVTQTIGPEGGTIHVGPHQLEVPEGALTGSVSITAVAPAGPFVIVRFSPHGLSFERSVSLTMGYGDCLLAGLLPRKQIVYLDDALSVLDLLPSADDRRSGEVTTHLKHFSSYAVAW